MYADPLNGQSWLRTLQAGGFEVARHQRGMQAIGALQPLGFFFFLTINMALVLDVLKV
jgi:hypothetical protein